MDNTENKVDVFVITKEIKDGWENLISGLNTVKDNTKYNRPSFYVLHEDETEQMDFWVSSGIGAKIIKCIPDDMLKSGWTIENDSDGIILEKMKELKTVSELNKALCWARLTSGSVVLIGVKDGLELSDPINYNRIQEVTYLKTFTYNDIEITESSLSYDTESKNFLEPEIFTLHLSSGNNIQVHISRLLVFKGEPIPSKQEGLKRQYFGISVLDRIFDATGMTESSFQYLSNILKEFIIGKYKLRGLANAVASGNEDVIKTRIDIIDMCKSILNSVMIDADGEDYTRDSASVSGLDSIIIQFMYFLSAVSEIPITKLFGMSPGGMNATGESDLTNYYDKVDSQRDLNLLEPLQKLTDIINSVKGFNISDPKVKFNPLFEMDSKEEAEIRKINAETDSIYLQAGVLMTSEVRSRFENGYSDIVLDDTLNFDDIEKDRMEIENLKKEIENNKKQNNLNNNQTENTEELENE